MDEKILKQYSDLKIKEKEIATQISELAPAILAEIESQGADKIEAPFGKFVREVRKTWKFSSHVEKITEELDAVKADEKATGKATFSEKSFLKFFEPKE